MPHLRALIFDVDGTLAETERDGHRVAFNQAFQAAGLPWEWSVDLYGELLQVAGGKERIRFYLDTYAPPVPNITDWTAFIADLHRAKTQCYARILQSGMIGFRPGIRRLITAAQQEGMRLAIATTSRLENALTLLKTTLATDAPDWFDVIAAGDIVPHKKPAPDIYHYVLDKMALPAEACLVFEDTEHGLTAATGAGLKTIVTVNNYTHEQDFTQATLVLNHLGDPDNPCQVLRSKTTAPSPYFDLATGEALLAA